LAEPARANATIDVSAKPMRQYRTTNWVKESDICEPSCV